MSQVTDRQQTPTTPADLGLHPLVIASNLRCMCLDYNDEQIADNAPTRSEVYCREIRQAADALTSQAARIEALSAEIAKVHAAVEARQEIYRKKRDQHDICADDMLTMYDMFEHSFTAFDYLRHDLGMPPRPDDEEARDQAAGV